MPITEQRVPIVSFNTPLCCIMHNNSTCNNGQNSTVQVHGLYLLLKIMDHWSWIMNYVPGTQTLNQYQIYFTAMLFPVHSTNLLSLLWIQDCLYMDLG